MTSEQNKAYIAALLRERAGAEQYGRTDTVEQIDAELAKVGHKAKTPAKRAEQMTVKPADAELRRGPGRPRKNAE